MDAFLAPVEGPHPSGRELRNDARFHALERELEPARNTLRRENGNAVPVDWDGILTSARELAGDGRDLRLLVIVTRALAGIDGFDGLATGLRLLADTVEQYWESVHPMLRPGGTPREAAVRRINALLQLENEDDGVLGDLRLAVILNPRGIGPIRGEDLAAGMLTRHALLSEAPSGLSAKEQEALVEKHEARVARVRTACRAESVERPEALGGLIASAGAAQAALAALEEKVSARVSDNGAGIKFSEFTKFLNGVQATLVNAQASASDSHAPAAEAGADAPSPGPEAAQALNPSVPGAPAAIRSREDVQRSLDMIIEFYERTEPSSPIPHIARRLRKMVPMNFLQIMEEVAPSGMKEFRVIAGSGDEKASRQERSEK